MAESAVSVAQAVNMASQRRPFDADEIAILRREMQRVLGGGK